MNKFYPWFRSDNLNGFIGLAIGLFAVLTLLYSVKFMAGHRRLIEYYACIVLTAVASLLVIFSNHLIILLASWGFLGLTLYLLINMGDDKASAAAKKALIIVGGTDALMLLGIGIIYYLTGTFQMDKIKISLSSNGFLLPLCAYLCIAVACFAKAGAMPFHSWIPDCAQSAPVPVVAYLPASLDKLLGIYLLARISLDLFVINNAIISIILMLSGAFTIIAAVMMALVQHNMKRLMGYHAVSQVGYMILGIGTANPIGIAGGIFHMLNNAVYKSCLFFSGGNVEYRANSSELDQLGGLARVMPLTYISCLIASLSISGVPPFNGFVSKWMVYQGIINNWQMAENRWQMIVPILCLIAAMFGSGLTLASFMKLIHAVFLGQPQAKQRANLKEVAWQMWVPCITLAIICVVFGVFANQLPLKYFILPAVAGVGFSGAWYAGFSTLLIIIGLALGLFIFKFSKEKLNLRQDRAFIGGEDMDLRIHPVTGTEFYNTVSEFGALKKIYSRAEAGFFDIYEQGKKLISAAGKVFQYLHNGILPTYLVWMLLGMLGIFFILLR